MLEKLCGPAILYIGFSLTQIILDIFQEMYNTAFLKFMVMIIFSIILNNEMNANLPGLEAEALKLEAILSTMRDTMKRAQKKEAGIPLYMMKSSSELQEEASQAIEEKLLLKAALKKDIEKAWEINYIRSNICERSELFCKIFDFS